MRFVQPSVDQCINVKNHWQDSALCRPPECACASSCACKRQKIIHELESTHFLSWLGEAVRQTSCYPVFLKQVLKSPQSQNHSLSVYFTWPAPDISPKRHYQTHQCQKSCSVGIFNGIVELPGSTLNMLMTHPALRGHKSTICPING